jgi:hypothetical protein
MTRAHTRAYFSEKHGGPSEIVAERVARIGRTAAVSEGVGIAMELSPEPFQVGGEDRQRAMPVGTRP